MLTINLLVQLGTELCESARSYSQPLGTQSRVPKYISKDLK